MNTTFERRLISALLAQDLRECERERKRGNRVNHYRLSHYLRAAEDIVADIATGIIPALAFSRGFIATREMHRVARELGLPLDVQRGHWTFVVQG